MTYFGIFRNGVLLNLDGMSGEDEGVLDPPIYASRELAEQALASARMLGRTRRECVVIPLRVVSEVPA